MYSPSHNQEQDTARVLAFMREYNFATLVTVRDEALHATHLPFLIEPRGEALAIFGHMARANNQWRDFAPGKELLVIFQEPHAFVSTKHYERFLSVPTWNYVAVHAYGTVSILEQDSSKIELLEKTLMQFEGNLDHWTQLPPEFKNAKLQGIVAFEIAVTRLEARFKLSQDRTVGEQERVAGVLSASPNPVESKIGELMRQNLEK